MQLPASRGLGFLFQLLLQPLLQAFEHRARLLEYQASAATRKDAIIRWRPFDRPILLDISISHRRVAYGDKLGCQANASERAHAECLLFFGTVFHSTVIAIAKEPHNTTVV